LTGVANSSRLVVAKTTDVTVVLLGGSANASNISVRRRAVSLGRTGEANTRLYVVTTVTNGAVVSIVRAVRASVFCSAVGVRNAIDARSRIDLSLQPITRRASQSITSAARLSAINGDEVVGNRVIKN
jgi:hypothetical protein